MGFVETDESIVEPLSLVALEEEISDSQPVNQEEEVIEEEPTNVVE